MTRAKKIFLVVILSVIIIAAGLYIWNPEARSIETLAEMTGEFSGFEKCFVTEMLGTETINNYEITENKNVIGIKQFLKDTEISYVKRSNGNKQEFSGLDTYRVILVIGTEKTAFDMDAEGEHIYYDGREYTVKDTDDMFGFHTNLPQTADTAISMYQSMGRQLAESVAAYLEILKGKAGTLIGEYLEPIYKEYVDHMLNSGKMTNSELSREDVIESIKRAQAIEYLIKKYNLEPEKSMIEEEIQATRQVAESDIETSVGIENMIREMGISADDFWNVYTYEGHLYGWRMSNLEQYIADNNLPSIDEMIDEVDAKFVIYDEEYFDSIQE